MAGGYALLRSVSAADRPERRKSWPPVLSDLKRRGFRRIYQNGQIFEYSQPESLLDVDFSKPAFVLVDRLKIAPDIRQRLIDSVEICFRENSGEVILEVWRSSGTGHTARVPLQRSV